MIHDYAAQMALWTGLRWYVMLVGAAYVVWFAYGWWKDRNGRDE